MTTEKALRHYELYEVHCMNEHDKDCYLSEVQYNAQKGYAGYLKTLQRVLYHEYEDVVPEDDPHNNDMTYIPLCSSYNYLNKRVLFKRYNEFQNVYYIRFMFNNESRCTCSRYVRSCDCDYSPDDDTKLVYNFHVTARDKETYAKLVYSLVEGYYVAKEFYRTFMFHEMAMFLDKNKHTIRKFGRNLYETLHNRVNDDCLVRYICEFVV